MSRWPGGWQVARWLGRPGGQVDGVANWCREGLGAGPAAGQGGRHGENVDEKELCVDQKNALGVILKAAFLHHLQYAVS